MIGSRKKFFSKYLETGDAHSLTLFRIAISLVLFLEVLQILYFQDLIFPFSHAENLIKFDFHAWSLIVWAISTVCIALGIHFRVASIVNFCFSSIYFGGFRDFEYHADALYQSFSFLLLFFPLAGTNSRTQTRKYVPILLAALTLGAMYFESAFHKLGSEMWQSGLGVWLPATFTFTRWNEINEILNLEFFNKFLSHATIVFEFIFIFGIWSGKLRPLLIAVGVAFHLGISLYFPIPLFSAAVLCFYTLLLPNSISKRILEWPRFYTFSDYLRRVTKTDAPLEFLKIRMEKWVVGFLTVLLTIMILTSPFVKTRILQPLLGVDDYRTFEYRYLRPVIKAFSPMTGYHPHGVFVQRHFQNYDHYYYIARKFISREGIDTYLPFINPGVGTADIWNTGRIWAYYTFRFNHPGVDHTKPKFVENLAHLTRFWILKNDHSVATQTFIVFKKENDVPTKWEKDQFLKNLNTQPQEVMRLHWRHGKFTPIYSDQKPLKENAL